MTTSQGLAIQRPRMRRGKKQPLSQGHHLGSARQGTSLYAESDPVSATCRYRHICLECHQKYKSQNCPLARCYAPYRRDWSSKDKGKRPFRSKSPRGDNTYNPASRTHHASCFSPAELRFPHNVTSTANIVAGCNSPLKSIYSPSTYSQPQCTTQFPRVNLADYYKWNLPIHAGPT